MFTKKMVQDILIIDSPKENDFTRRLELVGGKKIEFTPNPVCVVNVFDIETFIAGNTLRKRE